ncbi:unnamed protein product, partial [marine sediment metagenome]
HKYLDKKGVDADEYHRLRIIALDGLRHLSIHHMPIVKQVPLTIDTNTMTADFPDDFIDYVGLVTELDGRWWALTRDDKIVDPNLEGVESEDLSEREYIQSFARPGGENSFYYTPDYDNRRFLFNGTTTIVVVLRYKSTGVENVAYGSTNDVQIPVEAEETMEFYLDWRVSREDGSPEYKIKRIKGEYDDSLVFLRRIGDYSIEELRHIMLGSMTQTTNR